MFFLALSAGQPAPAQYLGQLVAQRQLAADAPGLQKVAAAQLPRPEHLHKGLTTC